MQRNNKKKICLVVNSLGHGGVERSAALISIMLSDIGHDVHIVSIMDIIDYPYKGTLLNLGLLKSNSNKLNRYQIFKTYLKAQKFDAIIDSRSRPKSLKQWLIRNFLYKNEKVFYMIHSYKLSSYLPKQKWVFNCLYHKNDQFVSVSNTIKNKLKTKYGISNCTTIYNAVNMNDNELKSKDQIDLDYEYVLFYGRVSDRIKNISLLIDAYEDSKLKSKNIKLLILGRGVDQESLKETVKAKNLHEYIKFEPYSQNPFPFIKRAKFTVLTSRYEGFPMVIPESLSLGVPVISVDCKSGPSEIIIHKKNGLLIENYNKKALSDAMNSFIFDVSLYENCKRNATSSIDVFSMDHIAKDWNKLIQEHS